MIERLAPLFFSFIGTDLRVAARRVKRNSLLYIVAGLFFLTAYISLIAGVYILLANRYGDIAAIFAIAVGALILAICVLIALVLVDRSERRRAKPQASGLGLLALGAATLVPVILKSRLLTGLATLAVIALLASGAPAANDSDREI